MRSWRVYKPVSGGASNPAPEKEANMRRLSTMCLTLGLLGPVGAASGPKVKPTVELARTWDAAVAEVKLLNVPIVLHSHGFECSPCWGMHRAVMQNKKYIRFASENTVEVISLSALEEGVEAHDRRAATYKTTRGGEEVKCMVEFPGLTVEEVLALHRSRAGTYNKTGAVPYTAVINPWTLEEFDSFTGGRSAKTLMKMVKAARNVLTAEHGDGVARKDLRRIRDGGAEIGERIAGGELAKAFAQLRKLSSWAETKPEAIRRELASIEEKTIEAGTKRLDELEAMIARGASREAARELRPLARALGGTKLQARAEELVGRAKA
jgi:hypothetical protein